MRAASILTVLALAACGPRAPNYSSTDLLSGAPPRQDTVQGRVNVAAAAEASGRLEVATSMLGAAARQNPGNLDVQARYAIALARSGNIAAGRAALAAPLKSSPDSPVLLRALGSIDLHAGRPAEAEATFSRLLAGSPRDAQAMDGQAIAFAMQGRYDLAQRAHGIAKASDPDNVRYANNLAVSMMLAGRMAEAVAILEPLQARPDLPERVQTNFALAQAAAGRSSGRSLLAGQASGTDIDAIIAALNDTSLRR